jgi:hypothetical protein
MRKLVASISLALFAGALLLPTAAMAANGNMGKSCSAPPAKKTVKAGDTKVDMGRSCGIRRTAKKHSVKKVVSKSKRASSRSSTAR